MSLLRRRRSGSSSASASSSLWTPEPGLDTRLRTLKQSVPFVYDQQGRPANTVQTLDLSKSDGFLDLSKDVEEAANALLAVKLLGIRLQVIVTVDGSGSMSSDYSSGLVQLMLQRVLGFTINVDEDAEIPVFVYGNDVSKQIKITVSNFQQASSLLKPDFGGTNMADAIVTALKLAKSYNMLTLIINITDGNPGVWTERNPSNAVRTKNAMMDSSEGPFIIKNLAIRPVDFLEEVDDLPSQIEYEKDENGEPIRDSNGSLKIYKNPKGIRLIDTVDSQAINPKTATDKQFAAALAEEIGPSVEMMGHVGHLKGVPGIAHLPHLLNG